MTQKEYEFMTVWANESDPDIVYVAYKPKLEIDIDIAKEMVRARLDFTQGKAHYVIIDFTNLKALSKEAREYMNDPQGGLRGILAGAFVSTSVVATLFVNLYLKINKPTTPARFFTNKEEALAWLHEQKKAKKLAY